MRWGTKYHSLFGVSCEAWSAQPRRCWVSLSVVNTQFTATHPPSPSDSSIGSSSFVLLVFNIRVCNFDYFRSLGVTNRAARNVGYNYTNFTLDTFSIIM